MRRFMILLVIGYFPITSNLYAEKAYPLSHQCPSGSNKDYVHKALMQSFKNSNHIDMETVHHTLNAIGLSDKQAINFVKDIGRAARAFEMKEITLFNYAYEEGKRAENAGVSTLIVGMKCVADKILSFRYGNLQSKFNGLNDFLNASLDAQMKYYRIISGENYFTLLKHYNEVDISGMMNIAESVAIKNVGGKEKFLKLSKERRTSARQSAMSQTIKFKNNDGNLLDLIVDLTKQGFMKEEVFFNIAEGKLKNLNKYVKWSSADFQATEGFSKECGTSMNNIITIYAKGQ